ncbi:hypothetical protein FB451DRAFT_684540 [Mycena latifolia]|nr:hypothetical protein FB451DRAFT_684540 [Mycena latifolia]
MRTLLLPVVLCHTGPRTAITNLPSTYVARLRPESVPNLRIDADFRPPSLSGYPSLPRYYRYQDPRIWISLPQRHSGAPKGNSRFRSMSTHLWISILRPYLSGCCCVEYDSALPAPHIAIPTRTPQHHNATIAHTKAIPAPPTPCSMGDLAGGDLPPRRHVVSASRPTTEPLTARPGEGDWLERPR